MSKIDLSLDPFEGDFGDGETLVHKKIVSAPKCNECRKPLIKGKCVQMVEGIWNDDESRYVDVAVHHFHTKCWLKIQKEMKS